MPSSDILNFLKSQGANPAPGASAATPPGAAPIPGSAPDTQASNPGVGATAMLTPQNGAGADLQAKVHARIALDILQKAVQEMSPDSPVAKRMIPIITLLARVIGVGAMDSTQALVPEQIRMMNASLPQTGNMNPAQNAALQSQAANQPHPPLPV